MTTNIFASLFAGLLLFGPVAATAGQSGQATDSGPGAGAGADGVYLAVSGGSPLRTVGDFGFYYRDRDGFFFGYDARDGRRWYRDWRRQNYYERYYDHRKRRWLHDRRHYRDWYRRYYPDWRSGRDGYRHDYRDRRDYGHRRGRGHGRHDDDDRRRHRRH